MDAKESLKSWIEETVVRMIDDADALRVESTSSERLVALSIHVAKNDLGKVIGRSGRNADAIRTLASAMGAKEKLKVIVEIVDDSK